MRDQQTDSAFSLGNQKRSNDSEPAVSKKGKIIPSCNMKIVGFGQFPLSHLLVDLNVQLRPSRPFRYCHRGN